MRHVEAFRNGKVFVEALGSLELGWSNPLVAGLPPIMKFPLDPSIEEGREGTEPVRQQSGAQAKRSDREGHDASDVERIMVVEGVRLAAWPLRSRRRPENRGDAPGNVPANPAG